MLFDSSESIFVYPFKVVYRKVDYILNEELKLGISVSKKSFKRAVKRNFVKRRIRESFRLNKQVLKDVLKERNIGMHLMLVYVSKELMEFHDVEPKVKKIVEKLIKAIEEDSRVDSDSAN